MKEEIEGLLETLENEHLCRKQYKLLEDYINNLQSQLKEKEEENRQLKADYGNLAQVERDFLKEVIKEAREYVEEHRIKNPYHYEYNCFMGNARASDLLEILSKGENK